MAKVKSMKMRLRLDPSKLWRETLVSVCYDGTDRSTETFNRKIPDKRLYIKLPQVVADALGISEVRGNDQGEVIQLFNETIEAFKKIQLEVNTVILYEFEGNPGEKEAESRFFQGQFKVSVWAGKYQETVAIAGDGVRRYSYERVESDMNFASKDGALYNLPYQQRIGEGRRFVCQVPWTEQNEAFFLWIRASMTELIARLHELKTPDSLIEMVSEGRLLPLGGQS